MAGVSDLPFRQVCQHFGAGLATSEMVTSDSRLWHSVKSSTRLSFQNQVGLKAVQLVGYDPDMLVDAARQSAAMGADIIDINMGCPARKVCKRAAGSALLSDERLVEQILCRVVQSVSIPVTLKIRTGVEPERRNALAIGCIAEQAGVAALAVHGRTRACRFNGAAEYDTVAELVDAISIPVIANGDIDSPEKALAVLDYTGAAGVMIGRGAQGNPWIFRQVNALLEKGVKLPPPDSVEVIDTARHHIRAIHQFYGPFTGVRVARKHIGWYLDRFPEYRRQRSKINQINDPLLQFQAIDRIFENPESQGYAA